VFCCRRPICRTHPAVTQGQAPAIATQAGAHGPATTATPGAEPGPPSLARPKTAYDQTFRRKQEGDQQADVDERHERLDET